MSRVTSDGDDGGDDSDLRFDGQGLNFRGKYLGEASVTSWDEITCQRIIAQMADGSTSNRWTKSSSQQQQQPQPQSPPRKKPRVLINVSTSDGLKLIDDNKRVTRRFSISDLPFVSQSKEKERIFCFVATNRSIEINNNDDKDRPTSSSVASNDDDTLKKKEENDPDVIAPTSSFAVHVFKMASSSGGVVRALRDVIGVLSRRATKRRKNPDEDMDQPRPGGDQERCNFANEESKTDRPKRPPRKNSKGMKRKESEDEVCKSTPMNADSETLFPLKEDGLIAEDERPPAGMEDKNVLVKEDDSLSANVSANVTPISRPTTTTPSDSSPMSSRANAFRRKTPSSPQIAVGASPKSPLNSPLSSPLISPLGSPLNSPRSARPETIAGSPRCSSGATESNCAPAATPAAATPAAAASVSASPSTAAITSVAAATTPTPTSATPTDVFVAKKLGPPPKLSGSNKRDDDLLLYSYGVEFSAKLLGDVDVSADAFAADKMAASENCFARLKATLASSSSSSSLSWRPRKQRVVVDVSLSGVVVVEEKSRRLLHHHRVADVVFIAFDVADPKNCGYIVGQNGSKNRFIGIRSVEKSANEFVAALQVVMGLSCEMDVVRQQAGGRQQAAGSRQQALEGRRESPRQRRLRGEEEREAERDDDEGERVKGKEIDQTDSVLDTDGAEMGSELEMGEKKGEGMTLAPTEVKNDVVKEVKEIKDDAVKEVKEVKEIAVKEITAATEPGTAAKEEPTDKVMEKEMEDVEKGFRAVVERGETLMESLLRLERQLNSCCR